MAKLMRKIFPPPRVPPLETLMMHFCGEIRLNHWYRCASDWHTEPVIKHIYKIISQDEARQDATFSPREADDQPTEVRIEIPLDYAPLSAKFEFRNLPMPSSLT